MKAEPLNRRTVVTFESVSLLVDDDPVVIAVVEWFFGDPVVVAVVELIVDADIVVVATEVLSLLSVVLLSLASLLTLWTICVVAEMVEAVVEIATTPSVAFVSSLSVTLTASDAVDAAVAVAVETQTQVNVSLLGLTAKFADTVAAIAMSMRASLKKPVQNEGCCHWDASKESMFGLAWSIGV
jgi:hypothetical protein